MKKIAILLLFLFGPLSPLFCCTGNPQARARRKAEQRRMAQEEAVLALRREELNLRRKEQATRVREEAHRQEERISRHEEPRGNPTLNRLSEENSNLQKKLAEMQARIALLSLKEKTPVAVTDAPPSYETVYETYEEVSAPGPSAPLEGTPPGYPIYEKK